jgi:nucleotide-binding universal stress UspA family protein
MQTILVPTDFSATADKALMIASELALKTNARIHVANFYSIPIPDISNPDITMPAEALDSIRETSKKAIKKLASELRTKGVNVDTTIEMGMVTDEVVDLAKKINADLIVMGTTGTSGVLDMLIGSNASNVMQKTEKPIILVPKDYVYDGIHEIVYADSLHEDDTNVLRQVFDFAEKIGAANVNILNINTSSHYEPVQTNLVLKLKEVFGFDKVNMNFVEAQSIKEGMDLYLDSHNIDLVVMSRHKKSLMERIFSTSNTKMMALYTKVPLMVYHK